MSVFVVFVLIRHSFTCSVKRRSSASLSKSHSLCNLSLTCAVG